jgi:hypothetical protein
MSYREKIERLLINSFDGKIFPLTAANYGLLDSYKSNSFGFSRCAFMLYSNGVNPKARSIVAPMGLIYHANDNIFSIGIYKRKINSKNIYVHITAPTGNSWIEAVGEIEHKLFCAKTDVVAICVRHINEDNFNKLISMGYLPISERPWDNESPSEDETFNHRFIDLKDIISKKNDTLIVKKLNVEGSRNFRTKSKSAYNRFNNFLENYSLEFNFYEYTNDHRPFAWEIVCNNFNLFHRKGNSVQEDYYNLLNHAYCDNKQIFSYLGFLENENLKIPVALFIGERISDDCVALYATLAMTKKVPNELNANYAKGYTALSQYCYIKIFDILSSHGINYVDLGGSESEELNTFKRQLGAKEKKTFWAIKILKKE